MTTIMLAFAALVVSVYFLQVDGVVVCNIRGKGKMSSYSSQRINIRVPCKYEATTVKCQGYRLHVAPTQAIDTKARYFTSSVWIGVHKLDTDYFWQGRTSAKRALLMFSGLVDLDPFTTKNKNLNGAPFKMTYKKDAKEKSVILGVSDAEWQIIFNTYDGSDKRKRKNNGVQIICPDEAQFVPSVSYPKSICGNNTEEDVVLERKKKLKTKGRVQTIMYDILNSDMVQPNAVCEVASRVFKNDCEEKADALKVCSPILTDKVTMKCLNKFSQHPMDIFLLCLKVQCKNDSESCDLLKEAMNGCPALDVDPKCKV